MATTDTCIYCGKETQRSKPNRVKKYCNPKCRGLHLNKTKSELPLPELRCKVCQAHVVKATRRKHLEAVRMNQGYCSDRCKDSFLRELSSRTAAATNRKYASERMKLNNPMSNPDAVSKMTAKLKGRTFLSRGGNGKLTSQQIALHNATSALMEFAIETSAVASKFQSLPNCYKVDLAFPEVKLAIEVDGKTHRLKKWKFLDARKSEVLTALGWSILRFTNEQVDSDLHGCLTLIGSTMSELKATTTTSQTAF